MGRDGLVNGRTVRMEGRFVKSYSLGFFFDYGLIFIDVVHIFDS